MIATPGQSTHIITPSAIAALRGAAGRRGAAADQLLRRQSQGGRLGGPADLRGKIKRGELDIDWDQHGKGCYSFEQGQNGRHTELHVHGCPVTWVLPTDLDQVHRLNDFCGGKGPA